MRLPTTLKQISVIQVYLLVVGILLLIVASTFVTQSREASADQDRSKLVKFSHELHVKDAGVACQDCHSAATASTVSSDNLLAKKANCESCHEDQLQNDCTYCHTSDDPGTYVAFESPQREVIFNHDLHINGQKMECTTCHQGLESMTLAGDKSLPPMATCNTCHDNLT
ncbi:MAG TPA: cytochrome c3 family protein, partial [Bacteroidota bacterium]